MLTFPSPVSVRPTSDHQAYQISPVWFVNSRVLFFCFVFLKQKSLSHKHSKVWVVLPSSRNASMQRLPSSGSRRARCIIAPQLQTKSPTNLLCKAHLFWAAFRDDYTMQSLKIICTPWRRANRLQLQREECFAVCWPSEVSEGVCLCVLEWGCVLKTAQLDAKYISN